MSVRLAVSLLLVGVAAIPGLGVEVALEYAEGAGQLSGGCFIQAIKLERAPAERAGKGMF